MVQVRANPYIHVGLDRLYNPHSDATICDGEPAYRTLRRLIGRGFVRQRLTAQSQRLVETRWLLTQDAEPDTWHYLRFVSIETQSACNQACDFCPVSVAPRAPRQMSQELFDRIIVQLACSGEPIEAVFLNGYNEPTLDRRLADLVRTIREQGLRSALLTNATGLVPRVADELVAVGGVSYLSVNLSSLDAERYRAERRVDHLARVLENLDYARELAIAEEMNIAVLGDGGPRHRQDVEEIAQRFQGSRFQIRMFKTNDRAGHPGLRVDGATVYEGRLAGCEQMGSRPIQHLHVDAWGRCVLCCQDYRGEVVLGDLGRQGLEEVLGGPEFARARRLVYGLDEAPSGFLCRSCAFARRADDDRCPM